MKTVAVTIDEATLHSIDRIARVRDRNGRKSRSEVVRRALSEYVVRYERSRREEHEARVIAKHKRKLGRAARALIRQQAKL